MAVAHFVTQFTHISKHFEVYYRKTKKITVKTVLKISSQFKKEMAYVSIKLLLEKSAITKQNK